MQVECLTLLLIFRTAGYKSASRNFWLSITSVYMFVVKHKLIYMSNIC